MTLRDEILTGPLAAQCAQHAADGGVAAILEILTKPRYAENGPVALADFSVWCGSTGLRGVVQDHAYNPASPLRSIALTVLDFLGRTSGNIDMSIVGNQQMLATFVASNGITQEQVDELLAMSSVLVSRADQLKRIGIEVNTETIGTALRG